MLHDIDVLTTGRKLVAIDYLVGDRISHLLQLRAAALCNSTHPAWRSDGAGRRSNKVIE
jgi:hypothetical protein